MIYSYLDTLLKNWVEYCETLLSEDLTRPENNLNALLGSEGSNHPTRAKEIFKLKFLRFPISSGTEGFTHLRQGNTIVSEFGYVNYLIAKSIELEPDNRLVVDAFYASSALCLITQYVEFQDYRISLSSIFLKLLDDFPIPPQANEGAYFRFLSASMFCELKDNPQPLIESVRFNYKIDLRLIEREGGIARATFRSSKDVVEAIENGTSLINLLYEKSSTFFIGKFRGDLRGLFYISQRYHGEFLNSYRFLETRDPHNNPFHDFYSETEYKDIISGLYTIYKNESVELNESVASLMLTLEDGCKEALKILKWTTLPTTNQKTGSGRNTIYFGAPGTGKSHVIEQYLKDFDPSRVERVTFHPEFDYSTFLGSYRPVSSLNPVNNRKEISYEFVPQSFINIFVKAWNDPSLEYFLVIEEINRGNCAEIFGDIFQLLDRDSDYSISPASEILNYLKTKIDAPKQVGLDSGKIKMPPNLNIFATMNTSDQSLMPMDSAFKRRWSWIYIPICYDPVYPTGAINEAYYFSIEIGSSAYSWIEFIQAINAIIRNTPHLGMDKCIGNFFMKPVGQIISTEEFIYKVMFYLLNDVFFEDEQLILGEKISFEDFFPIESNGVNLLTRMMEGLGVSSQ